ncbi:unnamed protein product [Peniophora sp. CBMAI 1063]|nr:unnamed protein product [Peniophora sp. CBMAI 1063]
MAVEYISYKNYFSLHIHDRYPGRDLFIKFDINALPLCLLPPLCFAADTNCRLYPGHLLIAGQYQMLKLPAYSVIQYNSGDEPPILCVPDDGNVWVNYDLLHPINAYPHYEWACKTNKPSDWLTLCQYINCYKTAPMNYPVLWTPMLSACVVCPGAIAELIHFALGYRFYVVLTELVSSDPRMTLFRACLLGTMEYSTHYVHQT